MRRVYHPYWAWEDWHAGMYRPSDDFDAGLETAHDLLASPLALEAAMRAATDAYPRSAEHNLSVTTGARAWLGQAACFYQHGVVEACTRMAWWTLSDQQRSEANEAADRVHAEWERTRANAETLFA